MYKLSIITINYNNRKGLKKTIASVFNQTFANYEYIIIDGGSTDGSAEEIKPIADKLAYWVSESDKGIYHAMNKGIRKATGEYCLFLNSGDCFTTNNILTKVFAVSFSEDIAFGDTICVNMRLSYPEKISLSYLISKSLPHQSSFIKRSLFDRYGYYNEENRIVSDWEFCLKVIQQYDCSYKYLQGLVVSKMELPGYSLDRKLTRLKNRETEQVLKNYLIPILKNKINDPAKAEEINEVFIKLFNIRDSKLVRLALKFEDSKFFYFLRKIYYRISKS